MSCIHTPLILNTPPVLTGLVIALLPTTAPAAPAKVRSAPKTVKTAAATLYECSKCHMKVSAAVAKKDHFKDPMDSGTLTPVKAAKK